MKKYFTLTVSIIFFATAKSQNAGIGITTPAYPLTVAPNNNGIGIVQKSGTVEMGFVTSTSTGGWLKTLSNHNLNFTVNHISGNPDPVMIISTNGNIGISTSNTPIAYKLDVNGRMRIRHNTVLGQTAGMWLDGTTSATRSFIGTINENHVGIYGSVIGWNLAMNVENGNTGIGTSAPTAKLDINGDIRLRSNSPKIGSVLTSSDGSGNVTWKAPVAFKAWGSTDGNSTPYTINPGSWPGFQKYYFSSSTDYNLGLHYNGNTSEFTAPADGIYHFDAQVVFESEHKYASIGIIVLQPIGSNVVVNSKYSDIDNGTPYGTWEFGINDDVVTINVSKITTELRLTAGQRVHVEIYRSDGTSTGLSDSVSPDVRLTWFSGHLVSFL